MDICYCWVKYSFCIPYDDRNEYDIEAEGIFDKECSF